MFTYEFFVTNKCNRNCIFCDISKGNFLSTVENAQIFINNIKKKENKQSKFEISFFGGEPLLAIDIIIYICEQFKNYNNCQFTIVTNGDLFNFSSLQKYSYFGNKFKICISTYDIFINKKKYIKLLYKLNKLNFFNIQFQYTFDENTIYKVFQYIEICKQINVKYKVAFSHSVKSWKTINITELNQQLNSIYLFQLEQMYQSPSFKCYSPLDKYFQRSIEMIFNHNITETYCISNNKLVFFNDRFIGPCIRYNKNTVNCPKRCISCQFKIGCFKSCVAEYINNDIDEKLCAINNIPYTVIIKFINSHLNEYRMKQILSFYNNY